MSDGLAGLPAATWLLLIVAVGLGLAVQLSYWLRHRGRR